METRDPHPPALRSPRAAGVPVTVPPFLVVAAILLLGVNLRGPIVAVSPVLDTISADLGIGATTAGLLTGLPVLCFGLATPAASALLARFGLGRGVSISLVVLLAGMLLRSVDGLPSALAGTLLIGVAITVGNVAVPVVIARDLPRRAGPVLGGYTAALNVGSMLTLSLTVPLAAALGWRTAVASWGVLVLAALALWAYATRGPIRDTAATAGGDGEATTDDGDDRAWWRRPKVWLLTAAFSGQAFAYYGVTAWLPLLLRDELGMARRCRRAERVDLPDRGPGRRLRGAGAAAGAARSARGGADRRRGVGHPAARSAAGAVAVAGVVCRGRGGPGRRASWRSSRWSCGQRATWPTTAGSPRWCRAAATSSRRPGRRWWVPCTRRPGGGPPRCWSSSRRSCCSASPAPPRPVPGRAPHRRPRGVSSNLGQVRARPPNPA